MPILPPALIGEKCIHFSCVTIGQFDYVLGKLGQIANSIIAMIDPILYYSVCAYLYVCNSVNCKCSNTVGRFLIA